MSVNRGKYKYEMKKEMTSKYAGNEWREDLEHILYLCNRLRNEVNDIAHVKNNPHEWTDRYYQEKTITGHDDFVKANNEKITSDMLNKNRKITYNMIKPYFDYYNTIKAQEKLPELNVDNKITLDSVKDPRDKLSHNLFKKILSNLNIINDWMDANWRKYFDDNGYCTMPCQVGCQVGCELTAQIHDATA